MRGIQHLNIAFKNDMKSSGSMLFFWYKIAPTTYVIDQVLAGFAGKTDSWR